MRESFIFYSSFGALIELLPSKKRLAIYEAIYHYGAFQKETDFSADAQQDAVWRAVLPQLKANQKRYENGKKGAESGILGGAPVGNTNARKTTPKTTPDPLENDGEKTTPKTTPNVNEYVNPYQDLQKCKRVNGGNARTREGTPLERFLERWQVNSNAIGNYSGGKLAGIDWDRVSEKTEQSADILQKHKDIGFFIRNYEEILDGKFDDLTYRKRTSRVTDDALEARRREYDEMKTKRRGNGSADKT